MPEQTNISVGARTSIHIAHFPLTPHPKESLKCIEMVPCFGLVFFFPWTLLALKNNYK